MMVRSKPDELKERASARRSLEPCGSLAVLATLDHYVLSLDTSCRLCLARRTRTAFDSGMDIAHCFGAIERSLAQVPRHEYKLLVDARVGPGRNDPAFEAVLSAHRGKLLFGFAKNAALASSAAGRLQIQRYAKVDGRVVFATDQPGAAMEYLDLPGHPI